MKAGLRILATHISSPALSPKTLACHLITRTYVLWTNCNDLQFSTSQIKASSSNQLLHERQKEVCSRYFWVSPKASFLRCFRFGAWVTDDTVSSVHTATLVSNLDFCKPPPPPPLKLEICRFQTPVWLHHSLPNCVAALSKSNPFSWDKNTSGRGNKPCFLWMKHSLQSRSFWRSRMEDS